MAEIAERDTNQNETKGKKKAYLLRHTSLGRKHNAGVIRQHVQPVLQPQKLLSRRLDGRQVGQVELQELDAAAAVGVGLLDRVDGLAGLVGAAAGDVDGGICGVQNLDQLEADARVAAGDDVDLCEWLVMAGLM